MTDRANSSAAPEVVVKLEIRVPVLGGAPSVRVDTEGCPDGGQAGKSVGSRSFLLAGIITIPSGSAKAVWQASAADGFVCAKGCAKQGMIVASQLKAKIFQGTVSCDSYPPPSQAGAVSVTPNPTTGAWQIDQLSGVKGHPNSNQHTCVVWATFDGTTVCESSLFTPVWGTVTDCSYPSFSGGGPSTLGILPALETSTLASLLALAVAGFGGPWLQHLNGPWKLSLQRGDGRSICYSNGGCGRAKPRWDLMGDTAGQGAWQLVGTMHGQSVTYSCDAASFQPLAKNRLTYHSCGSECEGSIPLAITVAPA
jgi:hypothetical protein